MAADGDNDLLIRQAKIADFKAVLDIYDDVYEGLDYMPTIYHEFFHSRQHIFYVAENSSGQLVGLVNFGFYRDGRVAGMMSARVHPDYRQQKISSQLAMQFLADHPEIDFLVFGGAVSPASQSSIDKSTLLYRWTRLLYFVDGRLLTEWSRDSRRQLKHPLAESNPAVSLGPSDCDRLVRSGRCAAVLQRYAVEFAPSDLLTLKAVRIDEIGMRELVTRSHVVASCRRGRQHVDVSKYASSSSDIVDDDGNNVDAVSFCTSLLLKTKSKCGQLLVCMFYFGVADYLADHVTEQLRHLACVSGGRDLHFHAHFPSWSTVDENVDVQASASRNILDSVFGVMAKFVNGIEAYLAKAHRA